MQISKGILLLPLLLIFCLLFGFTSQEEQQVAPAQPLALSSGADVVTPPVMEVLLLRLQVIQAKLDHDARPVPTALKDSLFDLSLGLRRSFDGNLATDFNQLTVAQQQIHTEVWKLVLALDVMLASDETVLRAV